MNNALKVLKTRSWR